MTEMTIYTESASKTIEVAGCPDCGSEMIVAMCGACPILEGTCDRCISDPEYDSKGWYGYHLPPFPPLRWPKNEA